MMPITEDTTEDTEEKDVEEEAVEKRYPSIQVAEARIKQALLKYKVTVDRVVPTSEKEKVRL